MMRFFTILAALPAVLAAPILEARGADAIAGKWIAKMRDDADDNILASTLASLTSILGAEPSRTYNFGSFKGFAMDAPDSLLTQLSNLAALEFIAPDQKVTTSALVTQANAPWGLARISSRTKGTSNYVFDSSAGENTFSYIIDTGVYAAHNDFGGRAVFGANFAGDGQDSDGNGHGTHCSGTTGSSTYGVAKKTNIIGVKVLDAQGSGSLSNVIAGIEFAVRDAKSKGRIERSVGNLSLGGLTNQATNAAVKAATEAGLFLAVAAGNNGLPAETSSPASEPSACTVGATDKNDALASFSNFGGLVDILAPGVDIISTWIRGPDDTNTISGTSMASPHVAGLAAYIIGLEGPRAPKALCNRLREIATKGAINMPVQQLLGTPNLLGYNGRA